MFDVVEIVWSIRGACAVAMTIMIRMIGRIYSSMNRFLWHMVLMWLELMISQMMVMATLMGCSLASNSMYNYRWENPASIVSDRQLNSECRRLTFDLSHNDRAREKERQSKREKERKEKKRNEKEKKIYNNRLLKCTAKLMQIKNKNLSRNSKTKKLVEN